jgi:D-alanine-D-alanine ligase
MPLLEACGRLAGAVDVVFLALHGPNGEDGTIQSLFHLLGLPYTGSDYYASSLAMNKPRAKDAYAAAGLDTPPYLMVGEDRCGDCAALAGEMFAKLGRPLVMKTTKLGSSVGVHIVKDETQFAELLPACMKHAGEVMLEQFIQGTEVTAPVIDNPDTGKMQALPLIEIRPRLAGWFDYESKYQLGGADEICPAPIAAELTAKCCGIGLAAHRILGCRGMSRTDILIDAGGRCWVIETNTIPGFTQTSLLPQSARAAGISYSELVDLLLQETLTRNRRQRTT